ncbi:hypothetical protein [Cellulomonas fimi]|uniref:Lipoprotein n=1 Tax=Cellulomonas fimi (strain ATCC 484 / DSM 20113 / JCM 1341 / CCUG 24087 / LMG 16345 / NBRC 15513 / NCIMB 8980 / NCTC 7547 / NRS-133) TaxID=590998 RepID=F4H2V0_CELFA|nr:hypothetical protein [Cellulomonas fimi]AEE46449.1 hypothetical protein Celf_2322 [Cellulomonas fimi ATCC 484]NNH07741.1 hypothetical protein [Cellulomonas fimi]VEH33047.1 Uncharacterised protein [Cellulomonas fimi]
MDVRRAAAALAVLVGGLVVAACDGTPAREGGDAPTATATAVVSTDVAAPPVAEAPRDLPARLDPLPVGPVAGDGTVPLGRIGGTDLVLQPVAGGAQVVDGSGTVVVGPTVAHADLPGAVAASGPVGDGLVLVGTAPASVAAPARVFYASLMGFGPGVRHVVELPTFRLPGDERTWYALVLADARAAGLYDTVSTAVYAGADGTLLVPGCEEDRQERCALGDRVLPELRAAVGG